MRKTLALLFLLSLCFGDYGQSFILLERTWEIQGNGTYFFDGALAVNDTNQEVVSITTVPKMLIALEDENIRLRYNGTAKTLKAAAIVKVNYSTNITQDPGHETLNPIMNTTNLTAWNQEILEAAQNLSSNSSLRTILNLVEFVHFYVAYNQTYFGEVHPATRVFSERRGVCVEYSHLLISMANSLGYDARYVSGYANGGEWQPHAWVEIDLPGYGWLPVDPTFNQIGILDSSHVAIAKGPDQASIYDSISPAQGTSMSGSGKASFINRTKDQKGLMIDASFSEQSGTLEVLLQSRRKDHVYSTYSIALPEGFGVNESSVVLLGPFERRVLRYDINRSLKEGYEYTIPYAAALGDSELSSSIKVKVEAEEEEEAAGPDFCVPAFALLLINLYISYKK